MSTPNSSQDGAKATRSYVVITPVRNEEEFLQSTIDSMAAQTVVPAQWIIVDDGSTDRTAQIAVSAAARHPWISVVQRTDRGFRKPGGGVVEAFCDGYAEIKLSEWDFLVKLDGDLSFAPHYFERCFLHFESDPKLGIGGGTICSREGNSLVVEAPGDPSFHVRGATKVYKRGCWEAIGGLIKAPGWDTVDEYKANMLGWVTYTFPELKLWHQRTTGKAQGIWKDWVKNGRANYVAGYHPLFMMAKCVKGIAERPFGIRAIGLMAGFVTGYLKNEPQVEDPELIQFVRQQQKRKLLFRHSLWDRKCPVCFEPLAKSASLAAAESRPETAWISGQVT